MLFLGIRKPTAERVVPKRLLPLNKNAFYDTIQAGLANPLICRNVNHFEKSARNIDFFYNL